MARPPYPAVDPVRDSALLLRRIGFLILMIGLPVGAFLSASGLVIAAAVGIALTCLATAFDGDMRPARESVARMVASPAVAAIGVLAGWSALSLLWTPAPEPSASRLLSTLLVVAAALAGYLALPDRMRSANLYPVPIGVALAALLGIALAVLDPDIDQEDARRLERGLAVLALTLWPAVAWLRSRGRDAQALGLAAVVALAAGLGPDLAAPAALAAGLLAYLVVQALDRRGAVVVGVALAATLLVAPLLAGWFWPVLKGAFLRFPAWVGAIDAWRAAILQDPVRLLTGHGIGSIRRGTSMLLSGTAFGTPALVLWYDLGLVGVASIAVALAAWLRGTGPGFTPLLPGLAAAAATGFVLSIGAADRGETWWPAALASVALAFVATQRGQFRTKRPKLFPFARAAA